MKVQKFRSTWNLSFLAMYEFVINSDRKTISQRHLYILYLVWGSYSTIFAPKNFANIRSFQFALCGLLFQIHQKLNHDILDWLNKPKIVRSCIYPIANLYFELSVDSVPKSNLVSKLILYYICSANPQPVRPFSQ